MNTAANNRKTDMTTETPELPALPRPSVIKPSPMPGYVTGDYTADQMQAYARQAVAEALAGREGAVLGYLYEHKKTGNSHIRTAAERLKLENYIETPLFAHPAERDIVLRITTAYEQGFGHALRTELSNPYGTGTQEREAWDRGREIGARKTAPSAPAPAWDTCVFQGQPPEGFASWQAWAAAPVKTGVTVRATAGAPAPAQPVHTCANAFSQQPGKCVNWCGDARTCPAHANARLQGSGVLPPAPAQGEREAGPLVEFVTQVSLGAYGSGELLRDARAALAAQPAAPADVLDWAVRLAEDFADACVRAGYVATSVKSREVLRTYLAQHLSAQPAAAPEPVAGWVLVPEELTEEMLDAYVAADNAAFIDGQQHGAGIHEIWGTLLAAAPSREAGHG